MAKPAPKRETVASLAQSLKSLESRLKGADTKNRNALKALEGVVSDIKISAKTSTTTQKAALTRGLNSLEARMETYLARAAADARAGVRSELANVTAAGANLSTLEQAVQSAHDRLDVLDATQRDSLARLNRHIAHLATSVEQRLKGETKAREAVSAALDAKIDSVRDRLESRVSQVEQDTVDALEAVAIKISEFATTLEDRSKTSEADTAERLADLAQETQSSFISTHTDVTERLEALEMIASAWPPSEQTAAPIANPYLPANADDPRIDEMSEMIGALQDELSRMHARMASVQSAAHKPVPNNVVPMLADLSSDQDNPYAAAARALEISATESSEPNHPEVRTSETQSAERQTIVGTPPTGSARQSHVPQEFDPTAFNQEQASVSPYAPVSTPPFQPAFAPGQDRVQNAELTGVSEFGDRPVPAAARGEYAETKTPTFALEVQDTLDAAVKAGNPIAQFQKGLVQLQAGQMEEGARLIRLAANRNQPAAQYRLAKLYESGTGLAKDQVTARELIERAARGGNRIAMHDLGNYHAYGQGGLTRDMGEALEWFTKAAERGVVDSQFNVAFLREGNEGVPADIETALFWYFIAARQGDQGAPERIGILSEQLDAAAIDSIKSRADRFNPKPVDENPRRCEII